MFWFELINAVSVAGALVAAAWQVSRSVRDARARDQDRRTERALELYQDVVADGATAEAFHRLSVQLRHSGSRAHGFTTWHLLSDDDFDAGGLLDPAQDGKPSPFADLYSVLWYFERVENSLTFGLVDREVLFSTIGFHCWWWAQLLQDVRRPKASHSVRRLGAQVEEWGTANGQHAAWSEHCTDDFGGHGPVPLGTTAGPGAARSAAAGAAGSPPAAGSAAADSAAADDEAADVVR